MRHLLPGHVGWLRGDPAGDPRAPGDSEQPQPARAHTRTHKHTPVSVCLRTERGVGKQWRTAGTTRPPPPPPIPSALCSIYFYRERGLKGTPPTQHRGTKGGNGAGWSGEKTRAATAEKREAAPGWSAGNEPEPWEGRALDPGCPCTPGRSSALRVPEPHVGLARGHLSSGWDCLNWTRWSGWGERLRAGGSERASG